MSMFNKVTKTFQYGQHTVTMETGQIDIDPDPDVRTLNSGVGLFWRATIFILLGLMIINGLSMCRRNKFRTVGML